MGVVTAHIVEEGTDVRVSFSGSIRVDPNLAIDTSNPPMFGAGLGEIGILSFSGPLFGNFNVGLPVPSSLSPGGGLVTSIGSTSFGFSIAGLFWSESDISGGVVGAVSEITVDPSNSFFVIGNTTLTDVLGASSVDGDTLWTATTTNDTIVLSTSPPVIVPEPSSAILCFFAGIGLLRRKR